MLGDGEVQLCWLADPERRLLPGAAALLSPAELDRARSFARPRDRDRYLSAHVGLRVLLGRVLGADPSAVGIVAAPCPLCAGPHGRPTVAGSPGLSFSLTYADGAALCALASAPVGVDLESVRHPASHLAAARRMHPQERAGLDALPPHRRPDAFLGCWVRKEAYLKGLGVGLAGGLGTYVGLSVLDRGLEHGGAHDGGAHDGGAHDGPPGWALADLDVPDGYRGAVALQSQHRPTFTWRSVTWPA